MDYLAIYEPTETGWSAYVPDLPGCVGAGSDRGAAERSLRQAVALHVEALRQRGLPIPAATSRAGVVAA